MKVRFYETKTKTAVILFSAICMIFGVFMPFTGDAATSSSLQKQLNSIQTQIDNYQSQIRQARQQSETLQNEVAIFDNQIASLELQIQANQTQTDDTKLQINEIQEQIKKREAEIADNKLILGQLIVQLNELDSNSWLYIGLSSDNFSKFWDQVQYTESVQTKVFNIVQNIKQIKEKLEAQEIELSAKLEELQILKEQLGVTQQSLEAEKAQKENLLAQTQGVESNYQRLLNQSKSQEANLLKEISDLDSGVRGVLGHRELSAKGALAMPMSGTVTQNYGNTGFTSLGYTFHNGMDIAATAGTPIYASADGVVSSCDTGEAAYGNWCTVKHNIRANGQNRCIVTLYAHMRSIKVRAGQSVARGDLIGLEGNSGNTTRLLYGPERGYHLHFSVFDCEGYGVSRGSYTSTYGAYTVPYGYSYNPRSFME